jgi:hypothetical protein
VGTAVAVLLSTGGLAFTGVAASAALATSVGVAAPAVGVAAPAGTPVKVVRYHGFRLAVPRSWPVYDLARHPSLCLRFKQHAV